MKKNSFVILCLRLLGIYFVIIGLGSVPSMLSIVFDSTSTPAYIFMGPVISILSGIILIVFAPKLSSFIIQFSDAEDGSTNITASEKTARIAFIVLGIYIFSDALPGLIQLSIDLSAYYKQMHRIPVYLRDTQLRWTYLLGPVLRLVIAAVLIIGPDKVLALVSRFDVTLKKIKGVQK